MSRHFTLFLVCLIFVRAGTALGHGFDLSLNSFSNPTSVTSSSQSAFFDLDQVTPAPQNLFLEAFSGTPNVDGSYSAIHGAAETAGAFPAYTATVNVVSPLYFADGTTKNASLAPVGTQIVMTDRFVGQYPGASAGSITITGQSGFDPPGFGVSLFDAHELLKQLYIGAGPTDGEYGFAMDITIHFASGQTLTTGPLVDVFATSASGDFADLASAAQQDAATRAIYGAAMADVNFDSRVDIQDITLIAKNWLKTGSLGMLPGDANRDGRVDIQDITTVATFWNPGGASAGGVASVLVPEPSGLVLVGVGFFVGAVSSWRGRLRTARGRTSPQQ